MKQNGKAAHKDTPGSGGNMVEGKEIKLILEKSQSDFLLPLLKNILKHIQILFQSSSTDS